MIPQHGRLVVLSMGGGGGGLAVSLDTSKNPHPVYDKQMSLDLTNVLWEPSQPWLKHDVLLA